MFISIFSTQTIYAQEPYYYTINDENGLPSNEVYQVIQDDFGYIWIGCDAGLFRYDGFDFKQFKNSSQNGRSISGLQLDSKNRIWCRNFNGQVFRVENDSLRLISEVNQNTSNNNFAVDSNCNAWIVCKNRLIQYNEFGKKIKTLPIPNSRDENSLIVDIVFYKNELYLSQSGFGIYLLKNSKLQQLSNQSKTVLTRSAFFIQDKKLHLLSEETSSKSYEISRIIGDKILKEREFYTDTKNVLLYKISEVSNNETWMCSSNGALLLEKTASFLDVSKGLLAEKKISNCLRDREGMYWFCTLNDGIFVFPSLSVLKYDPSNSKLQNKNVTAIGQQNNKNVIVGLSSGEISAINNQSNQVTNFEISSETKLVTTKRIKTYKGISYVAHGPLTAIQKEKNELLPFYHIRDFELFEDTLFYVASEFVVKIALKDAHKKDQTKMIFIRKTGGRNITLDVKNKRFYFVLNEGVFVYQNNLWKELKYKGKPIFASSLVFKNNTLWIASISSGLLIYKNDKFLKRIDESKGLKENEIKFLTASNQYIWACGNNYLYRISFSKNQVECLSKSNGINAAEIKTIEICNNQVFLGTNRGLMVFPEKFKAINNTVPKIQINSIFQGKNKVDFSNGLKLGYNHKNLHINLSSISFKSRSNFNYAYRLKGLNEEWIQIPVENKSIVLANLPSGNFILELKSINESGIESKIITIPVFVDSPIWKKWWFNLGISLISLGIISYIFYSRLKYIRRKAEQHEKLLSSQLTALKAQMNPHFMFNALNSIQDLVLEKDIKNSNLYLSKFSKLMRQILEASGNEKISLYDEIEILKLYLDLEKLRFGDEFSFSINWDKKIDLYDVQIPAMIIQPFIENAIKHGLLHKKGEKSVSIDFEINDKIICLIKDNGVGRKHANSIKERRNENHRSFATNATEKRIELLKEYDKDNYTFEIIDLEENGVSTGTLVKIEMPYRQMD